MAGVRTGAQGVLALGVGAGALEAGERQRRWGTQVAEARRRWGAQASGTAWARGALAGTRGRGRASQRAGVGGSDVRGARQAQARARWAAGWAACARLV